MTEPNEPMDPSQPHYPAGPPEAPAGGWPASGQWQPPGQWQATGSGAGGADILPAQTLQPISTGRNGRKAIAVGAAVLLLGGGAYASTQLLSDQRGASSPEEAARQLISAINDEDVLGVIDLLPDGERDLLIDVTDELSSQGRRLGVLSDGFRLDGFPGVSIDIVDPEFAVDEVSDGLAVVRVIGGRASFALDGDELAGSVGEVASAIAEANGSPIEVDDAEEEEVDLAELAGSDAISFAVIEQDGRWFPSVGFTVAELARRHANIFGDEQLDAPGLAAGIEPRGADSPQEALQALADAATAGDVETAISLLDPGELGALQVYAPLFLDDFESEDTGVEVQITDVEVTSLGDGVNRVIPTGVTASGDLDGATFDFELDGDCVTVDAEPAAGTDDEPFHLDFCAGDDLAQTLPEALGEQVDDLEVPDELTELLEAFEPIEFGIVTVERDGATFISPIRSLFDLTGIFYRGLERSDLEEGGIVFEALTGQLDDEFEQFFDDLGDRFSDQFVDSFDESVEAPIDGGVEIPSFPNDEPRVTREPTGASGPNGELLLGDVVQGSFPAGQQATFQLIGNGQTVVIGAQALDFADLTLTITDATGQEVASSDDVNGTDPEVVLELAPGEVFTVTVGEFFDDEGAFVVYYES